MPNANIVEIYCMLDEFSKLFDAALQAHGHKLGRGRARRRASLMSDAEVMTILVLFHTSDCRTLKAFTQKLFGRLVGDKGYISRALSERLLAKGIRLVTRIKRNMKNRVMEVQDKLLLRQRAVVETVIGMLKRGCQIEHTRRRSFPGFVANLCSGLIAYSFLPNKPKINLANESAAIHPTML